MMIRVLAGYFVFVMPLMFLLSCKKDNVIKSENETADPLTRVIPPQPPPPAGSSNLVFNFNAMVKTATLTPTSQWYTNFNNDSFTVSKFNYYISNLRLRKDDGSFFVETESYHLIKHVEGLTSFTVLNVPAGNYDQVNFMIGVDSARNVSGAQTGALDPANLMFWEWSSGYIFYKLEGQYNTMSQPDKSDYAIHIGGFSGPFGCIQNCSFNLSNKVTSASGKKPVITYKVQVEEVFQNPTPVDFTTYYNSVNSKMFKIISDNYKDMFIVDKVEN
jgi:hypothetical protein